MGSQRHVIAQWQSEAKSLGCPDQPCPRCQSEEGFRQHHRRLRHVLAIAAGFVVPFVICLKRWKCCSCGATFTHYPDFLVPYKRYVLPAIVALSEQYVTAPEATYRDVIQPEGMALGYAENEDGAIDERQLSHTTPWHWLTWLGGMTRLTDQAVDLLRQKDPDFELHRAVRPIFPGKYRSMKRKKILERAAELLRTGRRFAELFLRFIFPPLCNSVSAAPG
jgi:transposase